MTDELDPRTEAELGARLRAHFADRAAREPLPGGAVMPPAPQPASPWWRRPAVLAAAAAVVMVGVVGAALALRDDDPEGLLVTDGPTTTTTEATTPSTSTTVPPTTSTAPAAGTVRSVVVSVDGVLGWWDGTTFVRWDEGPIPLEGGEAYVLVGLDGTSTGIGSAPRPGCGITEPEPSVVDIPGLEHGAPLEPVPVAVTGVADPAPRPVEAIGAGPYVDAAVEALAGVGIDDPSPQLVQVLRTDLEGDGTDEVLIVAERLADPENLYAQPGDHSVLLLRQVVDGEVVTTVLEHAQTPPDGAPYLPVVRVAAVADLNGDGVMELVTQDRYYEGGGTSVWTVDPEGGAERVLDVGCGA